MQQRIFKEHRKFSTSYSALKKTRGGQGFNAQLQLDTKAMISRPAAVQVLDDYIPAPWSYMPSIFSIEFLKTIFTRSKQFVISSVSTIRLKKNASGGWKARTFTETVAEPLYSKLYKSIALCDKLSVKEIASPGAQTLIMSELRAQQTVVQRLDAQTRHKHQIQWSYAHKPKRSVVQAVRIASVMDDDKMLLAQVTVKHESVQKAEIKDVQTSETTKEQVFPVREYIVYEGYISPNVPIDWKIAAKLNPFPLK